MDVHLKEKFYTQTYGKPLCNLTEISFCNATMFDEIKCKPQTSTYENIVQFH